MRFNLEPGDAFRNNKYSVTIRINDREKVNLPSNSYSYNMYDSNYFLLSSFKCNTGTILNNLSQWLKLERNYYKLALVNSSNHPYYYYKIGNRVHIGTINDIPQELKKNGRILTFDFTSCSERFLPLANVKILIDQKDIISSKNITATLKEPNIRLKIQNREKFLEVYDLAGNKIGALNDVLPYFEQENYLYRKVSSFPLDISSSQIDILQQRSYVIIMLAAYQMKIASTEDFMNQTLIILDMSRTTAQVHTLTIIT